VRFAEASRKLRDADSCEREQRLAQFEEARARITKVSHRPPTARKVGWKARPSRVAEPLSLEKILVGDGPWADVGARL
jgi:hypothetical protein